MSQDNGFHTRIARLESMATEFLNRIVDLEAARDKQAFDAHAIKAQATQIEATRDLYAPLRSNADPLVKLAAFARRLLDPQDLGYAVTFEVRELAREALGKEKVG